MAVDTRERIEALPPDLEATHGCVTLKRARLLTGVLVPSLCVLGDVARMR